MPEHEHDLLVAIRESIDLDDPTPVYHQIAAVVRWELARGRLIIGALLPPVRTVAAAAGVNYHTVRRAWGDLEAEGVLDVRRGRGARLVRAAASLTGWRPSGAPQGGDGARSLVWVADDVLERAARLATRLADQFEVVAIPYPIGGPTPPPGPILVLHHDARADHLPGRWPGREGDLHPIEPILDAVTIQAIRHNARLLGVTDVTVVALDCDPAGQVAELLRQLPRVGLRAQRLEGSDAGAALAATGEQIVLHFPAAWQRLDWQSRMHPRVMSAEFEWAPGPLARVARRLGWVARER
jgi:hypothetical protein